jgi:uncharacterized protein (TIGR02996 family)
VSDHTPFLTALAERPGDDTLRLVYADWLDEHGQPDRAAFLRLEVQLRRAERGPGWFALCRAFLRAADATPDDWREVVSRPRLPGAKWQRRLGVDEDVDEGVEEVEFHSGETLTNRTGYGEGGDPWDECPGTWRQFGSRVELTINGFSIHRGTIRGDRLSLRGRELKPTPGEEHSRYSECWTLARAPGPDRIPNLD